MTLIDLAELDQRRKDAIADSLTIAGLQAAFNDQVNATRQAETFGNLEKGMKDDQAEKFLLCQEDGKKKDKEIRKQKRLKWFAIIGLALIEGINLTK